MTRRSHLGLPRHTKQRGAPFVHMDGAPRFGQGVYPGESPAS